MYPDLVQIIATGLFAVALVHTFATTKFEHLAVRYPRHAGMFHLLGEVEVVFGFWAIVLVLSMAMAADGTVALEYAESRNYDEPLFVFVVMVIAGSRPIVDTMLALVSRVAAVLPVRTPLSMCWLSLAVVPLMGSLITEPAAMTIAAILLAPQVFRQPVPERRKYLALGALLVNVSIGGTLTAYAAPPVLMVAAAWGWDSTYMLMNFGWKATIAVVINASIATWALRADLVARNSSDVLSVSGDERGMPWPVIAVHVALLAGVVLLSHHPIGFLGLFLLFLGFVRAYERHQSPLLLKEALLVAFFLAGLVVLGGMQRWWLQPIVARLEPLALFFGATALTAVTDNAALTYLGSLVHGMSDETKHMLVSGAVAGGGLTVIANAPNPAGAALLKGGFANECIGTCGLFVGAAVPTLVAMGLFLVHTWR